MKTREELIEEVETAIEKKFEADIHMARRLYPDVWKRDVAEIALAVFEKAHAPSDDEREVLLDELEAWQRHTGDAALGNLLRRVGSAIRRSEAHTPTDDFPHGHPEIDPTDDGEAAAERIIGRHLSRLSKRDGWAEDDTAIGGQAANIVRQLSEAGLLRRSEVPEPSAFDKAHAGHEHIGPYCMPEPEPQVEPSKGQINAAALELYGVSATYDVKRVAAALRAAWDAR